VAYAAAGEIPNAVEAVRRALAATCSSGQTHLLGPLEARLKSSAPRTRRAGSCDPAF